MDAHSGLVTLNLSGCRTVVISTAAKLTQLEDRPWLTTNLRLHSSMRRDNS